MLIRTYLAVLVLCVLGSAGCQTKCEQYCQRHVQCFPEETENSIVGSLIRLDCKWESGKDEAEVKCFSACNKEFDQLSYAVQDEVSRCMDCQLRAGGDNGAGCENYDQMFKQCDTECNDTEVNDFFSDFNKEADLVDELDCD